MARCVCLAYLFLQSAARACYYCTTTYSRSGGSRRSSNISSSGQTVYNTLCSFSRLVVSQVGGPLVDDALLLEVDDGLHGGACLKRDIGCQLQTLEERPLTLGPGRLIDL